MSPCDMKILFTYHEWLKFGIFTKDQLDLSDADGFIGYIEQYQCYIWRWMKEEK